MEQRELNRTELQEKKEGIAPSLGSRNLARRKSEVFRASRVARVGARVLEEISNKSSTRTVSADPHLFCSVFVLYAMDPGADLAEFYDAIVLGTSVTEAVVAAYLLAPS